MKVSNALRLCASTAAVSFSLLLATAASAQKAEAAAESAAENQDAGDIVVTASPRPTNRLDSSISVSTLSTDAVAESAPRVTAEIFRSIPGVRSESTGGDGNANIAVRGLPVASGGAKFLQLQEDGLPVIQFGDIAFGNADIFLRADQTIGSIQAVRGGSASTLASNAPGGIINFISKDGKDAGGVVMATVGLDYGEYRADFDYGAPISDNTRFNIGGFYRQGEGPRNAGYDGNKGYQIKANLTHDFGNGYVKLYVKHLNDRAIGYLPMPTLVTGSNDDPTYSSIPGFNIKHDTIQSKYFKTDVGLDGDNKYRKTDMRDGMHPVVTSIGLEGGFDVSDNITIENRFRYSSIKGRFVSPFPAEVGAAQGLANSVGQLLTGVAGNYNLQYATGPNAGQAVSAPSVGGNGLLMRVHVFNTEINNFDNFTNDFKVMADAGSLNLTGGLYFAKQNIDMDWVWNSYLLEVKGDNAALLNVTTPTGTVLSQGGLYAYGVPAWGNCCQRSYDPKYTIFAPYANIGFDAGPLKVDASIRYDNFKARGDYAGTSQVANLDVNGDGIIQTVERSVSTINNAGAMPVRYKVGYLSWSVGANYRLSDAAAVFARISRGGRANADRLLFGVVQPDGSVRKQDAIDYVDQYELGAKYRSGGLSLFATLFHAKTEEQNYEANRQTFFNRVYKATGLELEAGYRSGVFDLRAGATYTDAEISKDLITPANEGNTPRRQAKWIYQFTPAVDFDMVRAGFNVIGTSKAYAQDNNQLIFPGYAQVNAFVNFKPIDRVELSLNANNLFNVVGITEAEEGSITAGVDNYIRARSINGRTISASLKYSF